MLYREYRSKIEKISAVLKKIFKYRVPIIIALSAVTLSVTVLLSLRGIVVTGEIVNPKITYGEEFEYTASAMLSGKVNYEYRPEGGEWSNEKPTKAGVYYVRAVSKRTFGIKSYGDELKFEIERKPVEVVPNEKIVPYGNYPTVAADCAFGDEVYCTEFDVLDKYAFSTEITPTENGVRFKNSAGEDVTDSYAVTVKTAEITYTCRPITITAGSKTKEYDGLKLVCDEYFVDGGLFDGQEITSINFDGELTNVGTVTNRVLTDSVVVCAVDGRDVSEFYNITAFDGALTVTPRNITVTSNGGEKEYDGEPLIVNVAEITDGELVDGETIRYTQFSEIAVDAGEYENLFSAEIVGENGNVTENYNVTFIFGTLTVNKRPVAITTIDKTFVYNGDYQSVSVGNESWKYSNASKQFLNGQRLTFVPAKVCFVSDSGKDNVFDDVKVVDESGREKTQNYDITVTAGKLSVAKRPIKIDTESKTFVYNCTERSAGISYNRATEYELVDGHVFIISDSPSILNAGERQNDVAAENIGVKYGETDVTENYDIQIVNVGTLKVEKRNVTVTPNGAEKVYDGEPLICHDYSAVCTNDDDGNTKGFVLDHRLEVLKSAAIINVNDVANEFTDCRVVDGNGLSLDANYEITCVAGGKLIITRRPVTIKSGSGEHEYDGDEFTKIDGCDVTSGSLVEGHVFTVTNSARVTEVKRGGKRGEAGYDSILSYENIIEDYNVTFDGADSFDDGVKKAAYKDNYEFAFEYGELTITPRKITVTTDSADKVYDGTALTCENYEVTRRDGYDGEALVKDHKFTVLKSASITDVGTENNEFTEYCILDISGEDKTHDYDVTFEYGILTVTPRPIKIKTDANAWTYDGEYHSDGNFDVESDGKDYLPIADNQRAECAVADENLPKIRYVKDNPVQNEFVVKILSDGNEFYTAGDDVTANYDITYDYGELTITQRKITITANDVYIVYDGVRRLYLQDLQGVYGVDNIVDGDTVNIEVKLIDEKGGLNEGEYESEIKVNGITDKYGETVTDCYEITCVNGTLTVTKRKITVTTKSHDWTYDGQYHSYKDFKIGGEYGLADNQRAECAVADENLPKIRYVKDNPVKNEFNVKILSTGSEFYTAGDDVTKNYDITYDYGTLTVTKRDITVTANSYKVEYDGDEHTCGGYTITEGEFVSGDELDATVGGGGENASEYATYVTVNKIIDIDGVDVTDCYNITCVNGTLTVTPRKITVTTDSAEKVYDGVALTCEDYEVTRRDGYDGEALVKDHKFTVLKSASITDVGTEDNEFAEYCVKDNGGKDKTANYDIEWNCGTLTVNKRTVKIDTLGATFVYNGEKRFYKDWTYSDSFEYELVGGHKLEFTSSDITNVGTENNKFTDIKVISDDGTDFTRNYKIEVENEGTLEVTPRKVTVTPKGANKVYDGEPLICHDYSDVCTNDDGDSTGFVLKHGLKVLKSTEIINVSSVANEFIKYSIIDGDGLIEDETLRKNYEIIFATGEDLIITLRKIIVTTGSAVKDYDGTPLTCTDYESRLFGDDSKQGFVRGDKLIVIDSSSITEPGKKGNEFTVFKIVEEHGCDSYSDGFDVKNNYLIVDESGNELSVLSGGTLTVYPCKVTVTFGDLSFVYDGESHSAEAAYIDKNYTVDGLPNGFVLELSGFNSFVNVADSGNITADCTVKNGGGNDVTGYFEVTVCGTVTVTPRKVTIKTATKSFTYDGKAHFDDSVFEDVSEGENTGLLNNHNATTSDWVSITDYIEGGVGNRCAVTVTCDGDDVTDNYEFTFIIGRLTIEKRVITVTTASETFIFNGENRHGEYCLTSGDGNVNNLLDGHTLVIVGTSVKYVSDGGKENKIEKWAVVYNGDELIDKTDNYSLDYENCTYGTLTVIPAEVALKVADEEKPYDGTPLLPSQLDFVDGSPFKDFGYDIKPVDNYFTGSQTEVGESNSGYGKAADGKYEIFFTENGIDITDCFTVTLVDNGTLTVTDSGGGGGGDLDKVIGKIKADKSQTVYLKWRSYEEYDEYRKTVGTAYENKLGAYSYDYLTVKLLGTLGADKNAATVTFNDGYYALPFYWFGGDNLPESDVLYTRGSVGGDYTYSVDFYTFKYLAYEGEFKGNSDGEYYNFVKKQYSGLVAGKNGDDMYSFLNNIITDNNLSKTTPQETILAVIEYVRSLAEYNLNYVNAADSGDNSVKAFLEGGYKESGAVCRHYAAAATYLLRALGYPARVTEGYLVNAKAGIDVDIKVGSGHAWTEVYIEGAGWVIIDATPASGRGGGDEGDGDGSGGDGGDEPSPEEPEEKDFFELLKELNIIVKPKDAQKMYDGTPLVASEYEFVKRSTDENGNAAYVTDDNVTSLFARFGIKVKDGVVYGGSVSGNRVTEESGASYIERGTFKLYYGGENSITSKDGEKVLNSGEELTEGMFASFDFANGKLTVLPLSVKSSTFVVSVNGSITGAYNGQKLSLANSRNINKAVKLLVVPAGIDNARVKLFTSAAAFDAYTDGDYDYALVIPCDELYIKNVGDDIDFANLKGKWKVYGSDEDVTDSYAVIFTDLKYSDSSDEDIVNDLSEKAPTNLGEAGGYFEKKHLTLSKANITVTCDKQTVKYDEKEHTPVIGVNFNGLSGYKLSIISGAVPSYTVPGTYNVDIDLTFVRILDLNNNDVTDNFDITCVTYEFVITD